MEDRMFTRNSVILTLILLCCTAVAAAPEPIGIVSSCDGASIGGTKLVPGTVIYSGETIDVGSGGKVLVAVSGGGQVQVFENSKVQLTKSSNSIQVSVDRGDASESGKGIVVSRGSTAGGNTVIGDQADQKDDKDCSVSKDSRRKKHCKDGNN
jgi:hypothetical protein